MDLNYITSNGITPGGLEVGLQNPQTPSHALLGMVTVCFVPWHTSSLDQKSSTWMYVVALSVTCEQSEICLWEAMSEKVTLTHTSIPVVSSMIVKWGMDVEILTLAHMLKTPLVYTYHEDTKNWNRYSPNAVERSPDESNISERVYIRLARSHFDVVLSVNKQ